MSVTHRSLALLLLLATLVLSAAAFGHSHDSAAARACDICHVGELPVLEVSGVAQLTPPSAVEWHSVSERIAHPVDPLLILSPSRAPPA